MCLLVAAIPASADISKVLSVFLETSGPSPILSVDAVNSDSPVNGMVVRLKGEQGLFGLAACRTQRLEAEPKGPFAPGSRVRLAVPFVDVGETPVAAFIRVDSGGCEAPSDSAVQRVTVARPDEGEPSAPALLGPPVKERPLAALSAARRAKARCEGSGRRPGRSLRGRRQAKQAVLCLLNRERRRYRLRALRTNQQLARAAFFHSAKMVSDTFFAHVQPNGAGLSDRLFANEYLSTDLRRWQAGENIGFGRGRNGTPAVMVRAWMASSGHRANILEPAYEEVGIGLVPGTPTRAPGVTYTTDFGARSSSR